MTDFTLSCSTTADLSQEHFDRLGIDIINYHYQLDGIDYTDDLGKTISPEVFYKKMSNGSETKTSQVNVSEFQTYFEQLLQRGKDILHIELSSGITGCVNSARLAAENLMTKYPERKIVVKDSLAASSGMGLLVDRLAELRDSGKSFEECINWFDENRLRVHHCFFSSDLTWYIRGGRISKKAGLVGKLLNICPILYMNARGALEICDKVRTKRKAIQTLVKQMEKHAEGGNLYSNKVFISHSECTDEVKSLIAVIQDKFPHIRGEIDVNYIGPTIGAHTGPGTVALFFWGDLRENLKAEQ